MWQNRKEMEQEIRSLIRTRINASDTKTALIIFDGLETVEPLEAAIAKWRANGAERMIVGVGVMPSRLLEPAKKLVDELFVLKIPRFFKATGQYFAGTD